MSTHLMVNNMYNFKRQVAAPLTGVFLEPEHLFNLNIFYRPESHEQEWERLDIISEGTVTTMKMTGCGVDPGITINPNNTVFKIDAAPGGVNIITITITSTSEGAQDFLIKQEFIKIFESKQINENIKDIPTSKVGDKNKSNKQMEFTDSAKEFLETEGMVLTDSERGSNAFSLVTSNGEERFTIISKGTCILDLKFAPPPKEDPQKSSTTTPVSNKSKMPEAIKYTYVAKYNLLLGGTAIYRQWFYLGSEKAKK